MQRGLRQLGRSADGVCHAYLTLSLTKKNLTNIDYISTFTALQNVDLQDNALTSLKSLDPLIHLRSLNVCHNQLTQLLDMRAPRALSVVEYSHNHITSIGSALAPHRYLSRLNLASNTLKDLDGLHLCPSLTYVDVSQNQVEDISHINNPHLTHLLAADNAISNLSSLQPQPSIRVLDLSHNMVTSLDGLDVKRVPLLSTLRLPFNRIESLDEMTRLSSLSQLRDVDLRGNGVTKLPNYRFQLLFILPRLVMLDGVRVTAEEIVDAANFHGVDGAQREAILHRYLPNGSHTRPCDAHAPPPSASLAAAASVAAASPLPFSLAACLSLSSSTRLSPIAPSLAATSPSGQPLSPGTTIGGRSNDVPNRVAALVKDGRTLPAQMVRTSALAGTKLPEDKYWTTVTEKGFVGEWTEFMNAAANNTAPSRIDLSNIAAGDIGWWSLAQIISERKTVETLDLSSSYNPNRWSANLGDYYGFRALVRAAAGSRLRELVMERCSIGYESAPLLAELIRACGTLRVLRLSHNKLGEHIHALATSSDVELPVGHCPGLRALCRAIFGAPTSGSSAGTGITELDLSSNIIDSQGGDVLGEFIPRGRLQSLNISDNIFGEHGGLSVINGLKRQNTLRILTWTGGEQLQSKLPSAVLVAIGRLIARPDDQIAYLDVSNNISGASHTSVTVASTNGTSNDYDEDEEESTANGDEGCVSIATALARSAPPSTLTHLDVSNCGVGARGIRSLSRALQTNATLTSLNIMNAAPSSSSLMVFFWSLLRNTGIRSLDMTGVPVMPAVAARLADVIKRCNLQLLRIGDTVTLPRNTTIASANKLDEASWITIADAIATSENNRLTDLSIRGVGGDLSWRVIDACGSRVPSSSSASSAPMHTQAISPGGGTILSSISSVSFPGMSAIGASLRRLHVGGGTWTPQTWTQLGTAIRKLPSVTELSLANSVLPASSADSPASSYVTELFQCVLSNASITSLDLTSVYLGSEGALGLADGLADNQSLRYLVLDRCSLTDGRAGDNGMVSFARSLSQDQALFSLSLRGQSQPFSYAMLTGLVSSLSGNHTLTLVDLDENTVPYSTDHCQLFTWMLQASTSVRSLKLPSFLIGDNGLPHAYRNNICSACGQRDPNGSPSMVSSTAPTKMAAISPIGGGLGVPSSGAFVQPVTPRLVLPPQATTTSVSMTQMAPSSAPDDSKTEVKKPGQSMDDTADSDRCSSQDGKHKYDDGVCRHCGSLQDLGDVAVHAHGVAAATTRPSVKSMVTAPRPVSICPNSSLTWSESQSRRDNVISCLAMGLEKNTSLMEVDIGAHTFPAGLTAVQSRSLYVAICDGPLRRRLRTVTAGGRPIVTLVPASDVKTELLSGDQADNALSAQLAANRLPRAAEQPSTQSVAAVRPASPASSI